MGYGMLGMGMATHDGIWIGLAGMDRFGVFSFVGQRFVRAGLVRWVELGC